jgi:hypothetical protein
MTFSIYKGASKKIVISKSALLKQDEDTNCTISWLNNYYDENVHAANYLYANETDRIKFNPKQKKQLLIEYNKNVKTVENENNKKTLKWNNTVGVFGDTKTNELILTKKPKLQPLLLEEKERWLNYNIIKEYITGYIYNNETKIWKKPLSYKTIINNTIDLYKKGEKDEDDFPIYETYLLKQHSKHLTARGFTYEQIMEIGNKTMDFFEKGGVSSIKTLIDFIQNEDTFPKFPVCSYDKCDNLAFSKCVNCDVWYCCKKCQISHYKKHKKKCKNIKT